MTCCSFKQDHIDAWRHGKIGGFKAIILLFCPQFTPYVSPSQLRMKQKIQDGNEKLGNFSHDASERKKTRWKGGRASSENCYYLLKPCHEGRKTLADPFFFFLFPRSVWGMCSEILLRTNRTWQDSWKRAEGRLKLLENKRSRWSTYRANSYKKAIMYKQWPILRYESTQFSAQCFSFINDLFSEMFKRIVLYRKCPFRGN